MNSKFNHEIHEPHEKNHTILYKDESFAIQGAAFDVYREMGCGFLDAVYQECTYREFLRRNIPFVATPELSLTYKGVVLTQKYRPDFICYEKIIIELKAVKEVNVEHRAQVFNYLKATGFRLGLLINFGHFPRASVERIIV
jgi:GxxExxY protein